MLTHIEISPTERAFIDSYLECMYWAEDLGDYHLDPEFERETVIDCMAFFNKFSVWLGDDVIEQAGHDFWLSRQGHGTGFWDRDCYTSEWIRDRMQAFSEAIGEVYPITDELEQETA